VKEGTPGGSPPGYPRLSMSPPAAPPPSAGVRVAMFATDERGTLTFWDAGSEELWGMRTDEVLGRDVIEVLEDRIDDPEEIASALREGSPLVTQREVRRGDGTVRCHISVAPVNGSTGTSARLATAVDVTEAGRTERRLRAQYAATRALAESDTVEEAAGRLLRGVGESIGWDAGALWEVDPETGHIRAVEFWSADDVDAAAFEKATWEADFASGEGLPGHVWSTGEPVWLADLDDPVTIKVFTRGEAARTDGLRAGFTFPITVGHKVVGSAEFFRRLPAEPDPDLLEAMRAVGGQMGQFVERARALAALQEEERRLQQALEAGGMGAWEWEVATHEVRWSPNLERIHGLEPGTFAGTFEAFVSDVHPEDLDRLKATVQRALEEDRPYRIEYRIVRPDGAVRWLEARAEITRDEEGQPLRMGGVCTDVTNRREAELARDRLLAQAEEGQERLAFLAEVSAILASSLRVERTLEKISALVVPRLADWCGIDMLVDGTIRQMALAHADPERVELAREFRRRYPPDLNQEQGLGGVIRSGEPLLIPEVTDEILVESAQDEEHLRILRELDLASAMIVPLVARGRVLGAITFVAESSRPPFDRSDLVLADLVARRAAVAVDNARLYEERSAIARTLQRSLLPPSLPDMDGFEVAARYFPAGEGNEVGGDFYDVVERGADDWVVMVGDVCGKGPEAAALTGLTRYTLRAAVMEESQPSRALQVLNDAILREDSDRFCTATLARITREGGRVNLSVSCGGHPTPFVIRGDGSVSQIGRYGTLLGTFPDPLLSDDTVELEPGDMALFYTDGLTDHGGEETSGSPQYLRGLVERCAKLGSAEGVADRLEAEVRRFNPRGIRDDIAIVVLRVRP
jgi:PAS domain S-box-containing protein